MSKRLPYRCKNQQQAKDKATIYNSKRWKLLKAEKLAVNYLCERCNAEGRTRPATCVHHIVPIETATTFAEMERLAFCGLQGLMSLCRECHAAIHREQHSHSKEVVKERQRTRNERWKAALMERYMTTGTAEPETKTPGTVV